MATIQTRAEGARGCGWRAAGGLYLVSGELSEPCPLLPYETKVCPTCGEGIRPARGFTWVDGAKFIPPSAHGTKLHTHLCPLGPKCVVELTSDELEAADLPETTKPTDALIGRDGEFVSRLGRCGLIWVGEQHYKTSREFMAEAGRMGVSRRIVAVPRGFEVGETWVLLGHRKAIERACSECGDERSPDPECPVCNGTGYEHRPGVITAFKPTAIEYVVTGAESDEELDALEGRGITLVDVVKVGEQEALV